MQDALRMKLWRMQMVRNYILVTSVWPFKLTANVPMGYWGARGRSEGQLQYKTGIYVKLVFA